MRISNAILWNSQDALAELAAIKGLPFKTSYWLGRLVRKLDAARREVEQDRGDIIKRLGVKSEDGKTYSVPADLWEEFSGAFGAVLEAEVDIDIGPIDIPGDIAIPVSVTNAFGDFFLPPQREP